MTNRGNTGSGGGRMAAGSGGRTETLRQAGAARPGLWTLSALEQAKALIEQCGSAREAWLVAQRNAGFARERGAREIGLAAGIAEDRLNASWWTRVAWHVVDAAAAKAISEVGVDRGTRSARFAELLWSDGHWRAVADRIQQIAAAKAAEAGGLLWD